MGVKIVGDGGRRRVVTKGGGVFKGKKGREKGKNWREERTKKKVIRTNNNRNEVGSSNANRWTD